MAEVARDVEVFADAEDLPAHGAAVARGSSRRRVPSDACFLVDERRHRESSTRDLPLRPELVGEVPYGAPQLDVPVRLNVNENPYPPSEQVIGEIAAAVAEAARSMNRYPERDALALRADLARYLGHGLTAEQIWAANGSNEVMLHVLQAFAGPGRPVLSFAPTYSMYPEYARDTHSGWTPSRAETTSPSTRTRRSRPCCRPGPT